MPRTKWWRDRRILAAAIVAGATLVGALITMWPGGRQPPSDEFKQPMTTHRADLGAAAIETFSVDDSVGSVRLLSELRDARGLRPLQVLETGHPVSRAPVGAFFFVWNGRFDSDLRDWMQMESANIAPEPRLPPRIEFEVHKLETGSLELIAFVTEEAAATLGTLPPKRSCSLILSPCPWGTFQVVAAIPIQRIVQVQPRRVDGAEIDGRPTSVYVLDATVK